LIPSRVLVTGAAGFIGRHTVRDQLRRGRRVRAVDRDGRRLASLAAADELEILEGDIADAALQGRAVAGIDTVLHLASAHLERGLSEEGFRRVNVHAVRSLIEHCAAAGVGRFVHVSSCGVHGAVERPPADESAPFRPEVAYERTKLEGEILAREHGRALGLPVVVVRPAWVYGPECQRTARLFRSIAGGRFVFVGRGRNRRGSVYVSDFVDALDLCATREGIAGEVFIVVHDETVTVADIVEQIASLVGAGRPRLRLPMWLAWSAALSLELAGRVTRREPPISRRSLKFFANDASFTSAKAQRVLGFRPRVPLRDGLRLTYDWWRATGGGA
jgi:nucleoside-diphosphate-sugar epimerase